MKIGDLVMCIIDDGEGLGVVTKLNRWTQCGRAGVDVHVVWANGWESYWYRADELVKV